MSVLSAGIYICDLHASYLNYIAKDYSDYEGQIIIWPFFVLCTVVILSVNLGFNIT